jgi:hypothetical protein
MLKAPEGALQARLDERYLETEKILGRKIARWVQDNFAAIAACDPVMPRAAYNRLGDKWRPLFAVAQIIGCHWPQLVLDAFHALAEQGAAHAPSHHTPGQNGHQPVHHTPAVPNGNGSSSARPVPNHHLDLLLSDVRQVFVAAKADRLFSSYLVRALHALPNRPWSGMHNGDKPLTKTILARHLSALGIHSRVLRIGCDRARGYLLSSLPDLPAPVSQPPPDDFEI